MAHLVQRLVRFIPAVWGLACWAQSKPFSHELHLQLKLGCVECHASTPASTKASDNNLPDGKVCLKCHEKGMAVKEPSASLVTQFNHALHLQMGNAAPVIAAALDRKTYHASSTGALPGPELRAQLATTNACQACHRGLEHSRTTDHSVFPAMQDCLVCHAKVDNPFSCEKCHTPGAHLKPVSHGKEWVDVHSSGKANLNKASCVVCHGRRFTCLGCH
ncbi:MAG: cytochrome c3 family protein [Bryobacteraceae bacterium]